MLPQGAGVLITKNSEAMLLLIVGFALFCDDLGTATEVTGVGHRQEYTMRFLSGHFQITLARKRYHKPNVPHSSGPDLRKRNKFF